MFHNKTWGEKKKYFLDVGSDLVKMDRHWRERHRTGLMAFHLNLGFPPQGLRVGSGLPPGEHLVPSSRQGPQPFLLTQPLLPSAPLPRARKEGEPHLCQPACAPSPLRLQRRGRHCTHGALRSQTGLKGPAVRKRQGEFLVAEGGESPAVTKEGDAVPLHVESCPCVLPQCWQMHGRLPDQTLLSPGVLLLLL